VLESLGVVVARLAPNLAPIRRPRRATVTAAIVGAGAWTPAGPAAAAVAAVVALAAVWHSIPGIRPSAAAIYVVGATAIAAAFTVVTTVAIAAAAPLAARRAIAVHAFSEDLQVWQARFSVEEQHEWQLTARLQKSLQILSPSIKQQPQHKNKTVEAQVWSVFLYSFTESVSPGGWGHRNWTHGNRTHCSVTRLLHEKIGSVEPSLAVMLPQWSSIFQTISTSGR
jgi:hypothetical protein